MTSSTAVRCRLQPYILLYLNQDLCILDPYFNARLRSLSGYVVVWLSAMNETWLGIGRLDM